MNQTDKTVAQMLSGLLRCPECRGTSLVPQDGGLRCEGCQKLYRTVDGVPVMLPGEHDPIKDDMLDFWGQGYLHRFAEFDRSLTPERFREVIDNAVEEAKSERQFFGQEINLDQMSGRLCLEIGCGGGGHSLVLGVNGARIVATDLCIERTVPAARKIRMLEIDGVACQADAEELPFRDNTFDVVISYGVLHHTPKTEQAIEHVRRVLKPGGTAYILLYARHSFHYYVTELLYMGVLRGAIFRYGRDWLSAVTEMAQVRPGHGRNPLTKVYSFREVRQMFGAFSSVQIRKGDFNYSQVPGFERAERMLFPDRYRAGMPRRRATQVERALGGVMGFSLYITAVK